MLHDAIRTLLRERGASFWSQLRAAAPGTGDDELLAALWDLVWAGEVTNDSLAPLRAVTGRAGSRAVRRDQRPRTRPRPGRLNRIGPPAGAGRWSLVAPLLEPAPTPTESAHATALQLVERHGVVTREAVLAEGVVGGYASVYGVLKVLEERGQVRRGYFVSGLGAAQFALPGAVDRLRLARERADDAIGSAGAITAPVVLAATDPAQPYGATLAWPESAGRPARSAAALVVLRDGVPLAWYDRRSHHLVTFPHTHDDRSWAEALADLVRSGRLRKVEVRKVDGEPLASSPAVADVTAAAKAAGFTDGYRGLTFASADRTSPSGRDRLWARSSPPAGTVARRVSRRRRGRGPGRRRARASGTRPSGASGASRRAARGGRRRRRGSRPACRTSRWCR